MNMPKTFRMLYALASARMVFLWFLLSHGVLLCMMIFTFPKINTRLGTEAFDLRPLGYSVPQAMEMLERLDAETVRLYLFPQLYLFDVLYPLLLALFLSTFVIRLTKDSEKRSRFLVFAGIALPFLAALFDYTENLMITLMITDPGNASPQLIRTSSVFTVLKSMSTSLAWGIILIAGGFRLYSWLTRRHTRSVS